MVMTVKEAAVSCTPGSTNFSACVYSKSGKIVADWYASVIKQNELIKAANAVKTWVYFVGKGYSRLLAPEYFDYIPVSVLAEAVKLNEKDILMTAAKYNVDLPTFIDELIEK